MQNKTKTYTSIPQQEPPTSLTPSTQTTILDQEQEEIPNLSDIKVEQLAKAMKVYISHYIDTIIGPCVIVTVWGTLIGIAQFIWESTLMACDYDIIVCIKWLKSKFITVIWEIFAYSLIHYYIFLHALLVNKPYLRATGITLALGSFGYRYITSHGFSAIDHSKANVQLAGFMIFVLVLISLSFYFTLKCCQKSRKSGVIWTLSWTFFWFFAYYIRVKRSCVHLQDSLDERIKYSDDEGDCKWVKGEVCWHYTIDGIFRPFFWGRESCGNMHTNLSIYHQK